ncbi:hypothetical protein HMI54_000312 [Coelomomyces lativittatus]|nr:hypothetical protein HMI54_000312 [Coelomomyces lativittatus]
MQDAETPDGSFVTHTNSGNNNHEFINNMQSIFNDGAGISRIPEDPNLVSQTDAQLKGNFLENVNDILKTTPEITHISPYEDIQATNPDLMSFSKNKNNLPSVLNSQLPPLHKSSHPNENLDMNPMSIPSLTINDEKSKTFTEPDNLLKGGNKQGNLLGKKIDDLPSIGIPPKHDQLVPSKHEKDANLFLKTSKNKNIEDAPSKGNDPSFELNQLDHQKDKNIGDAPSKGNDPSFELNQLDHQKDKNIEDEPSKVNNPSFELNQLDHPENNLKYETLERKEKAVSLKKRNEEKRMHYNLAISMLYLEILPNPRTAELYISDVANILQQYYKRFGFFGTQIRLSGTHYLRKNHLNSFQGTGEEASINYFKQWEDQGQHLNFSRFDFRYLLTFPPVEAQITTLGRANKNNVVCNSSTSFSVTFIKNNSYTNHHEIASNMVHETGHLVGLDHTPKGLSVNQAKVTVMDSKRTPFSPWVKFSSDTGREINCFPYKMTKGAS